MRGCSRTVKEKRDRGMVSVASLATAIARDRCSGFRLIECANCDEKADLCPHHAQTVCEHRVGAHYRDSRTRLGKTRALLGSMPAHPALSGSISESARCPPKVRDISIQTTVEGKGGRKPDFRRNLAPLFPAVVMTQSVRITMVRTQVLETCRRYSAVPFDL